MKGLFALAAVVLSVTLVGCLGDSGPSDEALAYADGFEFTVDDAVQIIAGIPELPNQPAVVEAVAELWLDYTLVALAGIEDSLLTDLDLSPMANLQIERELIQAMFEGEVQADTILSDDDLRALYEEEAPGARVRARHILLSFPQGGGTPEQKDSVLSTLRELRRSIVEGGQAFADVARESSQDPGSAPGGGDLGFFDRATMVPPFAEVAFSIEPGMVSEPVETQFGYHLILVEERDFPSFDDIKDDYRAQVIGTRLGNSVNTFVNELLDANPLTIAEDASQVMKEVARQPYLTLSGRAKGRALAEFEGGSYTTGEFATYMQMQQGAFRGQILQAPDADLNDFVEQLAESRILYRTAGDLGYEVPETRSDSIVETIRSELLALVTESGLTPIHADPGETDRQAIARVVSDQVRGIVTGEYPLIPFGSIPGTLRPAHDGELFPSLYPETVRRITEARGSALPGQPQAPGGPDVPPDSTATPPDTTGG